MQFVPSAKCRQQLSGRHIFRHVTPGLRAGPTTGKARRPTVDSLTRGTTPTVDRPDRSAARLFRHCGACQSRTV